MVAGVILARRLGPELRGRWGLVLLAIQLAGLCHLGLVPAITYFTGKNEHDRGTLLTFALVSALGIGTIVAAVLYFVYPAVRTVWEDIPSLVMLIGLIAVPLTLLVSFFRAFLMGMLRVLQSNMLDIFRALLYLAAVVVLIYFRNGGVLSAAVCFTSSILLAAVLGLVLFARDIRPAARFDAALARPLLGYGVKIYIMTVFMFLNYRLDLFLIKYFLTTSDVAFYQIAATIAERMWYIPNALNAVLFPTLLMMDTESTKFTAKVCRNGFFLIFLLSLGLLFFGKHVIVFLYGGEYLRVTHALYSILWGITITSVYKVIFADFAAKKRLGIMIVAAVFSLVINVVLNIFMIPRFGIIGAGISTSISKTVLTGILIAFFIRYEGASLRELFIPDLEDARAYRDAALKALRHMKIVKG